MKQGILLIIMLTFISHASFSQTSKKYYDSSWRIVSPGNAYYEVGLTPYGDIFRREVKWAETGKLYSTGYVKDSAKSTFVGRYQKYYKGGSLQDSGYYNDDHALVSSKHYYESGKLWVDYSFDPKSKEEKTLAFDESGKLIPGFVYMKEADFPGGVKLWSAFLANRINPDVPVDKGAPAGTYHVVVRFIIDTEGNVADIEAETSLGYGMEAEVIRVIRSSPKWIPATHLNKKVNAYRRQPLTFVVEEEKKKRRKRDKS